MPMLWDIGMAITTGFLVAAAKPSVKHLLGVTIPNKTLFVIGLIFTQLVIVMISVWCWTNVDQNWLMLYWIDPNIIGTKAYFIYTMFPFFYGAGFYANSRLIESLKGRYAALVATMAWIALTIAVLPGFVTLFGGNDTAMHGRDYPPQFIWYLYDYPSGNALWFLPVDYGLFFTFFFLSVVVIQVLFAAFAIQTARTNFFKDAPRGKPSRALLVLGNLAIDMMGRMIVRSTKKDHRFRQLVKAFKGIIQMGTRDKLVERFLEFDGEGGVVFAKGRATFDDNDSNHGEIVYRSVRDMFTFLANYGDIVEGMAENRFELRGNLNLLYRLQALSQYFNPNVHMVDEARQPIIDEYHPIK